MQLHAAPDLDRRPAVADPCREAALLVDLEQPAGERLLVPVPDQALPALARRRRPDHGGDREALELLQPRVERDPRPGAGADVLPPADMRHLVPARHRLALEAGAIRVGVAMDEPDDLGLVGLVLEGGDHEPDRLARGDAEPVGVADELEHLQWYLLCAPRQREACGLAPSDDLRHLSLMFHKRAGADGGFSLSEASCRLQ